MKCPLFKGPGINTRPAFARWITYNQRFVRLHDSVVWPRLAADLQCDWFTEEPMIRKRNTCLPRLSAALIAGGMALSFCALLGAQTPERGNISGTVTADQGTVRGFRVEAHSLQYRIWYVGYTRAGHYSIPKALPGPYELSVVQQEYDTPIQKASLNPGQDLTIDIAVKKNPGQPVTYAPYDTVYPPGPGREILENRCMPCHGVNFYNRQKRTKQGWEAGLRTMLYGPNWNGEPTLGHSNFTAAQKDALASYLAAHFGPDSKTMIVKHDELVPDEEALSKAIFVMYDRPDGLRTYAPDAHIDGQLLYLPRAGGNQFLHDPF